MFKNFLRTLTLLTFLISIGNVMGSAPGIDAWKDNAGHPAPASVRRAADNLWEAVKREGGAAIDAGWGFREPSCMFPDNYPGRVLCCLLSCGLQECSRPKYGTHEFAYYFQVAESGASVVYDARQHDVQTALNTFKEVINASVRRPEGYSGDARVCELGPWVRDGAWSKSQGYLVSGRRDLSNVVRSTLGFVNAHGGWAAVRADEGKVVGIIVREEGKGLSSAPTNQKFPIVPGKGKNIEIGSRGSYQKLG